MIDDTNTTGKIQATMHPEKGLMTRKPREKKFYVYSQNSVPGEYQRAITVFLNICDVDERLLADSSHIKSTAIICSKCGEYVMRYDSADGKCRDCFLCIDDATERYQTSIDRFAAMRTGEQFNSAGDSLGRFS